MDVWMFYWFSSRLLRYQVTMYANPEEIKQAFTLLAEHKAGYQDYYGTDVPPSLRKVIGCGPPDAEIHQRDQGNVVLLFADSKGGPFLVIDPSSDHAYTQVGIVPWRPGMYFVR